MDNVIIHGDTIFDYNYFGFIVKLKCFFHIMPSPS